MLCATLSSTPARHPQKSRAVSPKFDRGELHGFQALARAGCRAPLISIPLCTVHLFEYATNQAQRNFCGTLFENMNEDSTVELHVRLLVSLQPRPEKEPHRELASLMR